MNIAYRDDGAPDAPAILLCSMATAALPVWDSVTTGLREHWRVIRYDRRGDGDSDPGARESHTFYRYVRDATCVLDACGCRRAVICGMAFGARVAYHLVMASPERATGLVLFDATGGPPAPEELRKRMHHEAAEARRRAGIVDTPTDPAWFARRDARGAGLLANALKDLPAWVGGLEAISVPTLVACGEFDPNYQSAKRIAAEIPRARFEPMPLTGHASVLDRPDLILKLIRQFLEDFA
ncbi:MAG TPA: alpha/beta hydrolase [Rhizomicrobium sp.]|nr:alpha/beta hydrolase [Rhizomicrobium sp.]